MYAKVLQDLLMVLKNMWEKYYPLEHNVFRYYIYD